MTRLLSGFRALAVASAITLSVALLAFAFLGLFVRYMGDDWCTAVSFNKSGLLEVQRRWYLGWTGRFSFTLAAGVAHLLGSGVARFLPALMLALWLMAASWAAYQFALAARWPRPLLNSVLVAEFFVFAALNTAHNVVQSFYWQTGALTYVAPLVLLTFYVGLVVCAARRPAGRATVCLSVLSCVVTFAAGGFSETYVCMQTGLLLLAVAALACRTDAAAPVGRAALPPVVSGLAGSVLAMLVVALAPGNAVRQDFLPSPSLLASAKLTLYYATGHIPFTVYLSPFTTLLTLVAPALVSFYLCATEPERVDGLDPRKVGRLLILIPVAGYVLILLCYAPAAYAMSTYLPGRARIIPQFVFVCVSVTFGYLAGVAVSQHLAARGRNASRLLTAAVVVTAALLVLSPGSAAWRALTLVEGARESALVFDQMDSEIRAARERGVMDQTVTVVGDLETRFGATKTELQIERDPGDWKNKCLARFYGISSIRAR